MNMSNLNSHDDTEKKNAMRASNKLTPLTHPSLHLHHPTIASFTWNTIIKSQIQQNPQSTKTPVTIFNKMRSHGVNPDFHTFPFLLQALKSPFHCHLGQNIHSQVVVFGFHHDPFVQTCLINMYCRFDDVNLARKVFDEAVEPDLPTWNSIINGYVKMGLVGDARRLFDEMPERNVVSWSCMMDGYARQGECREVLVLFREMQNLGDRGIMPNEFTMSVVLSACAQLGMLELGKSAHAYIDNCRMEVGVVLGTSLIDMYAKCGSIERARWVFNNLGPNKDVMAWSAMISGLAMHGYGGEAIGLFSEMISHRVRPNVITFLGLLCACAHGGLVGEGELFFKRMTTEYGISPLIQHYGCMVDLYGRAGLIDKAWDIVNTMPMAPDVLIWGAILSGSRMHGEVGKCEVALRKLIELEPTNSGAYVLLSNVYAKAGKWNDVRNLRNKMDEKGIKKVPGYSTVEIEGISHNFFVGDQSHLEYKEILLMLDVIMKRLKMEGYISDTKQVLLDLDEEGKEMALWMHSEKIAVAYAILKTREGTPIHIVKNLRICGDCHVTMKMISEIFRREIVVRDCYRFHHFVNAVCSCKDYW